MNAFTAVTTPNSTAAPQIYLPNANVIICQDKFKRELVACYAATAFNVQLSTILRVINNYLDSWPGLTSSLITKTLIESIASAKGHLGQE